jgi:hypothetical protein
MLEKEYGMLITPYAACEDMLCKSCVTCGSFHD